jgi:hypothetical protein
MNRRNGMSNVSRDLLEHFERSTARVNAAERRRVRRERWVRAGKVAFVAACFVAGLLATTCGR